jgi:hypothetical protein
MKKVILMLLIATGISFNSWAENGKVISIKKTKHSTSIPKITHREIQPTTLCCISYSTSGFCCDVSGVACGDNVVSVGIYIYQFLNSYCPTCSCS